MNATMSNRMVSLIPERVARLPSGAVFTFAEASACRYPERVAHLVQFLNWMSPLNPITKDDQRILGLRNAAGRLVHAADLEEEGLSEAGEEHAEEIEEVEAAQELEGAEAVEELEVAAESEAAEELEVSEEEEVFA